jgi:hypothetical protein
MIYLFSVPFLFSTHKLVVYYDTLLSEWSRTRYPSTSETQWRLGRFEVWWSPKRWLN